MTDSGKKTALVSLVCACTLAVGFEIYHFATQNNGWSNEGVKVSAEEIYHPNPALGHTPKWVLDKAIGMGSAPKKSSAPPPKKQASGARSGERSAP